jgi:hypothetical protein
MEINSAENDKQSELSQEYLNSMLDICRTEYAQLEEECSFLVDLLTRKYYKNITEAQFCNLQRKRNV